METKLERIAEVAKSKSNERFTSLIHMINKESLIQCHNEMKTKKASGVDEVAKEMYDNNLLANIDNLIARMKMQAYKPQLVKRVYIPKAGTDDKRPL